MVRILGSRGVDHAGRAATAVPVAHGTCRALRRASARRRNGAAEWWRANKSYVDAIRREDHRTRRAHGRATHRPAPPRRRMVGSSQPWPRRTGDDVCTRRGCGLADCGVRARLRPPRARAARCGLASTDADPRRSAPRTRCSIAARALGVATMSDLASYYFLNTKHAKPCVAELVDARRARARHRQRLARSGVHTSGRASPPAAPRARHAPVAVRLADLGTGAYQPLVLLRLPHRGIRPGAATAIRLLRVAAAARRCARRRGST